MAVESIESYGQVEPVAGGRRGPGSFGAFTGKRAYLGAGTAILDRTSFFPIANHKPVAVGEFFLRRLAFGVGSGGAKKFGGGRRVQADDVSIRSEFFHWQ